MAIITTGNNFGATAAVTSTTLNDIANAATFDEPVDGTSLELKVDGKLGIKDAGVTKAKIENISAPLRVLGRTTAGAGVPEEVTINDDNDMANASAITLATDESIKAYVDTLETAPVNLTLLNSAVAFGGDFEVPSYYRTADNIVHLRGTMKDSAAQPVTTLPAGFRPANRLMFATAQEIPTFTYGTGRVDVLANGDIELYAGGSLYNSLDGISFLADGT